MRAPQRYETQKAGRQLRLIHHPELKKGLGFWVWVFKREGNFWEGEKRECLVNKDYSAAEKSLRPKQTNK